ncbi:hypothetical protein JKA74_13145 [Marivirga sp. S37H4]|uniref:Uncharacterized protein n=1 Tax=Marivirga aurantiaca TaxID=2802615 RepID=A0A934WZZ2_9BACT|nr:hypothetical protein [Marivirga aurantiaca]MBK6265982.1 hypothetical protein [Marivirga aurantiaca]
MKNLKYLCLFLFTVFLASCSDEEILDRKEDKITGTWYFKKAFYKADYALFRNNIMDDYRGDYITFYPDYSALYDDSSMNAIFDGFWTLFLDRYENDDRVFNFEMSFYDHINGTDFIYYGELTRLSRNSFHMVVDDGQGEYTFKLEKLK